MSRAPAHADLIDDEDDRRAEKRRQAATPGDDLPRTELGDRSPGSHDRSQDEMHDGDEGVQVDGQSWLRQRPRPVRSGVHQLQDGIHDLGFERRNEAMSQVPVPQQRAGHDDQPDAHERRSEVDRLPPLSIDHGGILPPDDQKLRDLQQVEARMAHDGGDHRTAPQVHNPPEHAEKAGRDSRVGAL